MKVVEMTDFPGPTGTLIDGVINLIPADSGDLVTDDPQILGLVATAEAVVIKASQAETEES